MLCSQGPQGPLSYDLLWLPPPHTHTLNCLSPVRHPPKPPHTPLSPLNEQSITNVSPPPLPRPVGLQQDNTGAPWLMYSCLRTEGTCLALLFYRDSSRNRLREFHTKLSVGSAEHSGTQRSQRKAPPLCSNTIPLFWQRKSILGTGLDCAEW